MRNWVRAFWERRRHRRYWVSGVTAVYWSGGIDRPWPVSEISLGGAVIETPDDWYRGTLVRLVLHNRNGDGSKSEPLSTYAIWARVVRRGPQGICVEFKPQDETETAGLRRFISALERMDAPDQRALGDAA